MTERVLLGFSKSDRNNFREMRKLAATFGPTEKLATEGQENRENYTGGSGYYLSGPYRRSGWTIRKESLQNGLAVARPFWISPTGWKALPAKRMSGMFFDFKRCGNLVP